MAHTVRHLIRVNDKICSAGSHEVNQYAPVFQIADVTADGNEERQKDTYCAAHLRNILDRDHGLLLDALIQLLSGDRLVRSGQIYP